jgi:vacuole morphology and inheritance protein 14
MASSLRCVQALLVHVKIAQEEHHFRAVLRALLERFQGDVGPALLQKRGTLIIRGLCGLLGGTKVLTELASILEDETNSAFAASITQALNILLLTAPELSGLRNQLQMAQHDPEAASLLRALYRCWCHSACAALSLCMLAQAYAHVHAMIHVLAELPLLPVLLAQVDRCGSAFLRSPRL